MDDFMPQPLLSVTKRSDINITQGLPVHKPELCTLAMHVISIWPRIDQAIEAIVVSLIPGKADPIAKLIAGYNADSPKTAVRLALAESMLEGAELDVFHAIIKKCEAAFSLRNPLAHWCLSHSPQLPEAILALNPKSFVKLAGSEEKTIRDLMSITVKQDRVGTSFDDYPKELADALQLAMQKHLSEMFVYREGDLRGIIKEMGKAQNFAERFRILLMIRHVDPANPRYTLILSELSQELGLPKPTGAKA